MGLGLFAHDALGETSTGFIISYILVRIVHLVMLIRAGYHNPISRPFLFKLARFFFISVSLWTLSIFVAPPFRYVLWILGIMADIVAPFFSLNEMRLLPKLTSSHLPERFGLFTIIVLGESVVGVVNGAAGLDTSIQLIITAVLGLSLSFFLWWLYFDNIAGKMCKFGIYWRLTWTNLHFPLLVGLTAVGASVLKISENGGAEVGDTIALLLCGSMALALFAISLLELTIPSSDGNENHIRNKIIIHIVTAFLILILGTVGGSLSGILLLAIILVLIIIIVLVGIYYHSISFPELAMDTPA